MIAVVNRSATDEQLDQFIAWIEGRGFKTDVSQGANETIVGIIGDTSRIDPFLLESMSIIERVQRVSEPFKMASRDFHPKDTVVDCGHGVLVGGGNFQVIAGPGAIEPENVSEIAERVHRAGATILSGDAFKPRTSPYSYQGMGEAGLDLLLEVASSLDMPIVSQVADPRDVEMFCDRGVDVLEVGIRNAQNYTLLREVGKTGRPVLLKRASASTIDEFLMAAEYVMSEGNPNVMLCECGIRTFETRTRATFDVNAISVLRHLTHLPVLVDPSHATGYARHVRAASFAATAAGADGLKVEVHTTPEQARSGAACAITPAEFHYTMRHVRLIREAVRPDVSEV